MVPNEPNRRSASNPSHRQIQAERNAATRESWKHYAHHRRRVAELIFRLHGQAGSGGPQAGDTKSLSLCVLGSGNANDIELDQLSDRFARVVLVDIDHDALVYSIDRIEESRTRHAADVSESNVHAVVADLARTQLPLAERTFDVVVSVGLLSQLIEPVAATDAPAEEIEVAVRAARTDHLSTMLRLTSSGGQCLLVWEIVSSATCAELLDCDDQQLPLLLRSQLEQRNFFTGMHPKAVLASLASLSRKDDASESQTRSQRDASGGVIGPIPRAADPRIEPPWKWSFSDRVYAATALTFSVR